MRELLWYKTNFRGIRRGFYLHSMMQMNLDKKEDYNYSFCSLWASGLPCRSNKTSTTQLKNSYFIPPACMSIICTHLQQTVKPKLLQQLPGTEWTITSGLFVIINVLGTTNRWQSCKNETLLLHVRDVPLNRQNEKAMGDLFLLD